MILVTGASGLVGRELIGQLMAAGQSVRGMDLLPSPHASRFEFQPGDLLDPRACRAACQNVETIVHTAARQHHSAMPRWGRDAFFAANAEMTRNLVDAAIACRVTRFVFISSDMVYGRPPGRELLESDTPSPIGPYGRSKLASEQHCSRAAEHGIVTTILRPRLIIGPGRLGILQKLFDRIRLNKPVPIFGDGHHRYQMVAVADVAAACCLAIHRDENGLFNLGSTNPPTVRELLLSVCRRAASTSTLLPLPARLARAALWSLHGLRLAPLAPEQFQIADVDYVLDTTLARTQLGWQPRCADADMLAEAYATYVKGLTQPVHFDQLRPHTA